MSIVEDRASVHGVIAGPKLNFRRFQYLCTLRMMGDVRPLKTSMEQGRFVVTHPMVQYSFIPLPMHRSIVPPDPDRCEDRSDFLPSRIVKFPKDGIEAVLAPCVARLGDYKIPLSIYKEFLSMPNVAYRPIEVRCVSPIATIVPLFDEEICEEVEEPSFIRLTPVSVSREDVNACLRPEFCDLPYLVPAVVPSSEEERKTQIYGIPVEPSASDHFSLPTPFHSYRKVSSHFNGPMADVDNDVFVECGVSGVLHSSVGHIRNEICKTPPKPPLPSLRAEKEWDLTGDCCGEYYNYLMLPSDPLYDGRKCGLLCYPGDVILYKHVGGQYVPRANFVDVLSDLLLPNYALIVEVHRKGEVYTHWPPPDSPVFRDPLPIPRCSGHLSLYMFLQKRQCGPDYDRALSIILDDFGNYVSTRRYVSDPLLTQFRGVPSLKDVPGTDEARMCVQGMRRALMNQGEAACLGEWVPSPGVVIGVASGDEIASCPNTSIAAHVQRGMRSDTGWLSSFSETKPSMIGNMAVHMSMSKMCGGELLCYRSCEAGGTVPDIGVYTRSVKQREVISTKLSLGSYHTSSFSTFELWWASQHTNMWIDYPLLRHSEVGQRLSGKLGTYKKRRILDIGPTMDFGGRYETWY